MPEMQLIYTTIRLVAGQQVPGTFKDLLPGDVFLLIAPTGDKLGPYVAKTRAWQANVPMQEGDFTLPFDDSRDWTWTIDVEVVPKETGLPIL